jgi:DNA-binding LacI/PurR family transcriptional regulator
VPVTIKDIAKAAGVSHTTVSRALKDNPVISAETTALIQKLAQEMGYTPSAVAQSLLSQQTLTVGMVVTSIADPFVVKVVDGVESVAQTAGYSIFLSSSQNNPDQEMAVVETFHRRRVDAIIVTASRVGSLYTSQLDQIQVPIVLINNQEEGKYLHSVAIDDEQGAQLAVQHLLDLRHRRIAYVGMPNRPKSNRRRLAGYQTALKQANINADPELIFLPDATRDFEQGQMAFKALATTDATAVFCYNDVVAIGLLFACHQHNVSVPQELSIIGFDDIETAEYVTPPLTSIHQPCFKMGELAMNMVLDLLAGQEVQDKILSGTLVTRGSTAKKI